MRRARAIHLATFPALVAVVFSSCAVAASATDPLKPTEVVCLHGAKGAKPAQHPHNCTLPLTFSTMNGVNTVFFDLRMLHWRNWGSAKAAATGLSINPETHARTRVHLTVSGLATCKYRAFYSRMLVERPRRLNPRHLTASLAIPTCPPRRSH
jgi:hypothetical protein